jgi:serine/threonine-protein kinase RsbT
MSFTREFEIVGGDFANAGRVSTEIKAMLRGIGYPADVIRRTAIASYEAEMNTVMYAHRGRVRLGLEPGAIHLVLEDEGPGIPDIDQAMREGFSTATDEMRERGFGAGMGLPNIRRNADRFEITSEVGQGTRLEITVLTGEEASA